MAWPRIDVGSGGNRNQWLQQWAGEPTKPGRATLRSWSLLRCPANRTQAIRSFCDWSWISLPTSPGTKYGSVRGGLLPASRQALYALRASVFGARKLSDLADGSSPRHWPWRWVATVK